jgi:hypothetical protein
VSPNVHENSKIESARFAHLADFMEWLRDRRLVSAKRIPHYARWVQNFLRYRGMRPREAWQDSLKASLTGLQADPRRLGWRECEYAQNAVHGIGAYAPSPDLLRRFVHCRNAMIAATVLQTCAVRPLDSGRYPGQEALALEGDAIGAPRCLIRAGSLGSFL